MTALASPTTTGNTYYTLWTTYGRSKPSYATHGNEKKRLPGVYPMDWDLRRAKALVDNLKNQHCLHKSQARRDRAESAVRHQHSKQMFDHALQDATNNSTCADLYTPCDRVKRWQQVERDSTGPTRHGSPIYNKRATLLNHIRVKTAAARLQTDEGMTERRINGTISHNIDNYNQIYEISMSERNNSIFVERGTCLPSPRQEEDTQTPASPDIEEDESKDEEEDGDIPQFTISEAPELMGDVQQLTDSPRRPAIVKENDALKLAVNTSLRPISARSSVSVRSDVSSVTIRPRTWVDDLSVSSSDDETELDSAKSRNQSETNRVTFEPKLAEELADKNEELQVDQLPDLICPSSEEKSREYAVRLWLVESDFTGAAKTIPLL